jgi:hypothetical protein
VTVTVALGTAVGLTVAVAFGVGVAVELGFGVGVSVGAAVAVATGFKFSPFNAIGVDDAAVPVKSILSDTAYCVPFALYVALIG